MAASEHFLHPKKGGKKQLSREILNKNLTPPPPPEDQLWKDAVLVNLKSNPVVLITFWRVITKIVMAHQKKLVQQKLENPHYTSYETKPVSC